MSQSTPNPEALLHASIINTVSPTQPLWSVHLVLVRLRLGQEDGQEAGAKVLLGVVQEGFA